MLCIDCKLTTDLELDHVNASEKISHRIWSWSEMRRNAELIKCVVRCVECHKIKTTLSLERPRGIQRSDSVLTESNILEIKRLYATGMSKRELGCCFDVNESTIRRIIAGNRWAHIKSSSYSLVRLKALPCQGRERGFKSRYGRRNNLKSI